MPFHRRGPADANTVWYCRPDSSRDQPGTIASPKSTVAWGQLGGISRMIRSWQHGTVSVEVARGQHDVDSPMHRVFCWKAYMQHDKAVSDFDDDGEPSKTTCRPHSWPPCHSSWNAIATTWARNAVQHTPIHSDFQRLASFLLRYCWIISASARLGIAKELQVIPLQLAEAPLRHCRAQPTVVLQVLCKAPTPQRLRQRRQPHRLWAAGMPPVTACGASPCALLCSFVWSPVCSFVKHTACQQIPHCLEGELRRSCYVSRQWRRRRHTRWRRCCCWRCAGVRGVFLGRSDMLFGERCLMETSLDLWGAKVA